MKKVYRIYILETGLTSAGVHNPFLHALDRHGVRDYQSYEEAEEVVVGNELENATILAVYVKA